MNSDRGAAGGTEVSISGTEATVEVGTAQEDPPASASCDLATGGKNSRYEESESLSLK